MDANTNHGKTSSPRVVMSLDKTTQQKVFNPDGHDVILTTTISEAVKDVKEHGTWGNVRQPDNAKIYVDEKHERHLHKAEKDKVVVNPELPLAESVDQERRIDENHPHEIDHRESNILAAETDRQAKLVHYGGV
eukprot:GDKJ01048138.1.p2 GENE.GDKJ01048138.1~~GDKJ01048138.1.p2  ORF type:complete len:134 (+),score=25.27 GDKJ01048138.1:74-475(+)